jgi:hypothetical protein
MPVKEPRYKNSLSRWYTKGMISRHFPQFIEYVKQGKVPTLQYSDMIYGIPQEPKLIEDGMVHYITDYKFQHEQDWLCASIRRAVKQLGYSVTLSGNSLHVTRNVPIRTIPYIFKDGTELDWHLAAINLVIYTVNTSSITV